MKRYVKAETAYTDYFVQKHGNSEYHVHITGETPDFAAQMTKVVHYDDADYYWAKIKPNKDVLIIRDGKIQDTIGLPDYVEEDYDSVADYIDMCLDTVLIELAEYNKKIKPKMMYD